jgi:hypothetical protein
MIYRIDISKQALGDFGAGPGFCSIFVRAQLHFPPMPSVTDYALARRAVLRDFRRGTLTRVDVCDAHPELMRAAQFIGTDIPD